MAKDYFEFTYTDRQITSLEEWVMSPNSILKDYSLDPSSFLEEVGEDGRTNLDRIWDTYTERERIDDIAEFQDRTLDRIKVGTNFVIPKSRVNNEVLSITGKDQFLTQGDFEAFWSERLLQIQNDPGYVKVDIPTSNNEIKIQNTDCRVWIWVRSLNRIINVSPYIQNLTTYVDGQNNTFNFGLSPISDLGVDRSDSDVFASYNMTTDDGKDNINFFSKFIQKNDVVFIRYETLQIEQENEQFEDDLSTVSRNRLPNRIYDMIGLVDSQAEDVSQTLGEVKVDVTGRDFMKLLQEDGSWFFPLQFVENSENFFINQQGRDRWIKRNFATGTYEGLLFYAFRTIQDTLGFIINQLSNLGVVDEDVDLFQSYTNRTRVYRISEANQDYLDEVETNGVWQIIRLFVDDNAQNRVVADSSLSQPDGTLLSQFNKICQTPFVEFYGDTYGDRYELIVRQPPFTQDAVLSFLQNNNVVEIDDYHSKNIAFEDRFYTWYQLTAQQALIGDGGNMALSYLPIVYFPQYAEVFGNHRMSVVNNYIPRGALIGDQSRDNANLYRRSALEDLSYLIESNAHLPFTRRGTITLHGDRRIKRGTYIRFNPTGEIFYVSSVRHNLVARDRTVDRTTTIEVSRGMVEDFIAGRSIASSDVPMETSVSPIEGSLSGGGSFSINVTAASSKPISYFNIVDTDLIKRTIIDKFESQNVGADQQSQQQVRLRRTVKTNFGVDEDTFNFFLNRGQFR